MQAITVKAKKENNRKKIAKNLVEFHNHSHLLTLLRLWVLSIQTKIPEKQKRGRMELTLKMSDNLGISRKVVLFSISETLETFR